MKYFFDRIVERRGTHCEKWDELDIHFGMDKFQTLSMWVADMEFPPPVEVDQALKNILKQEVYGYFGDYKEYHNAIINWMKTRHGWNVQPEWILTTHGIVVAMNTIVQAFCRPGDKVILNTPIYPPFFNAIKYNGCQTLESKLVKGNGKYVMDFDDLEKKMPAAKLMFLCSPHNPGGRVWTRDELAKLAELCLKHNVLLVSDEIHMDLVYEPHKHTVLATLDEKIQNNVITCTSATKTFNMAGTLTGNVIIKNEKLRKQLLDQMHRNGMFLPNSFGPQAATAAYTHGLEWLTQLLPYLTANRDLIQERVANMDGIESMELEGTYLAWLDFSRLPLSMDEIISRVQDKAGLALNHGPSFGPGGEQHMRLNFACPRASVEQAMDRLQSAFSDIVTF